MESCLLRMLFNGRGFNLITPSSSIVSSSGLKGLILSFLVVSGSFTVPIDSAL